MPSPTVLLPEDDTPQNRPEQSFYFSAFTEETGRELYRLDADSGTPFLIDINAGAGSSDPAGFTEFEGALYFRASTEETGRELYWLEPGSSTPTLIDINVGAGSSAPFGFTEFGGDLYFRASTDETGEELYRLEAGSSTPVLMADINPGTGSRRRPSMGPSNGNR